jgi:membrane-associated phospholipid phosphatase
MHTFHICRCFRSLMIASAAAWPFVAFVAAQGSIAAPLDEKNASELQALLAVQGEQAAVVYANRTPSRVPLSTLDRLLLWNEIALDTTAIDHTPVAPGETRVFGEQFGPTRSSRAMAIVHIALFDSINAYYQQFTSYTGIAPVSGDVSIDYAIAQAAHDTLVWLYPSQQPRLDALFAADAAKIAGDQAGLAAGSTLGKAAAAAIIALRTNDGSQYPEPVVGVSFFPINEPGYWQPDPISNLTVALGARWGQVTPFVMTSGSQFRAPPPPALTDPAYTVAYDQTKTLGGDPLHGTPTTRNGTETFDGKFWSYDGTPGLCAPPRLYNEIARTVALAQNLADLPTFARFLALVNTAMADAGISAWDGKYYYQFWRPVTGIRAGSSDNNPNTQGDPSWYPLGAQATNTTGPNFTPPFPAYPSGHATFGGALFEIFRKFWPDNTPFKFVSDEFNGKNRDVNGNIRPHHGMFFPSFSAAEYQNAESRIWLGVHWQFDADAGIQEGNAIADYVFAHAFQPVASN